MMNNADEGMMFYLDMADGTLNAPFADGQKWYFYENGEWHPSPFYIEDSGEGEEEEEPAGNPMTMIFYPDGFASEIGITTPSATFAPGTQADGDLSPIQIDLDADGSGDQTISITDGYGDGGVQAIEFQNAYGEVVHTIVPSYTTGPYDIIVYWDGSELYMGGQNQGTPGVLTYVDLNIVTYTVLVTTDNDVGQSGYADETALYIDGADVIPEIGANATDYPRYPI